MKLLLPCMLAVLLSALVGVGCADILGADFDRHPHKSRDADASDGDITIQWPDAGRGTRLDIADGADSADAPFGIDVRDSSDRFDAEGALDANRARDRGHIEDTGPASDASDAADVGDPHDGPGTHPDDARDGGGRDAADDTRDGTDVVDADTTPPPDARTTGVVGAFVSLGAPSQTSSVIQLRGQVISNAAVRGVTSSGISIEGKIR
jgi:hypothetical protein